MSRICPECGVEVELIKNEKKDCSYYRPVNKDLDSTTHNIPFACGFCKSIKFPFKAPADFVYIWPLIMPETAIPGGLIVLPDICRELIPYGVVLAFGPGYFGPDYHNRQAVKKSEKFHPTPTEIQVGKKVIYDCTVPWEMPLVGSDRTDHMVKYCTFLDVKAIVEDEYNPFILEGVI